MSKDLLSLRRPVQRHAPARRAARRIQLSTTIALVVSFALAVIAVSIGIAQAETLGAMVEDEAGRLALFGLVFGIVIAGGVTAIVMWLTAPASHTMRRTRIVPIGRTSATSF
jgi:hypothetical protein